MTKQEVLTKNIFDFLIFVHAQKKVEKISEVLKTFHLPSAFLLPAILDKGLMVKTRYGKLIPNISKGKDIIVMWKHESVFPTMKTAEELYKILVKARKDWKANNKNKKTLKGKPKKELYPIGKMIEDRLGDWGKERNLKTSDDLRRILEIEFDVPDTEDCDPTELLDMIDLLRMDDDYEDEIDEEDEEEEMEEIYDERSFRRDIERAKSRFKEYSGEETEIEILVSIKTNKTIML